MIATAQPSPRNILRHTLALLAVVAAGCASSAKPAAAVPRQETSKADPATDQTEAAAVVPAAPQTLPPRAKLPKEAHELLAMRMEKHGQWLNYLLATVIFLEYDTAADVAGAIAAEPKLGRPARGDTKSLNALLPREFYEYQDALAERAHELAVAARARSQDKMVRAFGALAETCVACHAAYLSEDSEPDGSDEL